MTLPDFPKGRHKEDTREHGAVAPLSPSEAGPLLAPWIPPKQQPKGAAGGTSKRLTVSWCGSVPTAVGAVAVWEVPYNPDGSSATFHLERAMMRIETPGSGSTTAVIESAAGGDVAFASATTEASLAIAAAHYQASSSGLTGTVSSGDLLRLRFTAVGGSGADFSATLVGTT